MVSNRIECSRFRLSSVRLWKRWSGLGGESTWCILSHFLLGWCRILILGPLCKRITHCLSIFRLASLWCLWNGRSFRWRKSICCFDWSCVVNSSHHLCRVTPKEAIIYLLKIFNLFSFCAAGSRHLSRLMNRDGVSLLIWHYTRLLWLLILCRHSVRFHGTTPPELRLLLAQLLRIHL